MTGRRIQTDVLVVGGGGAGFRAAIGAREKGANLALLSKGPLARCGASPMAGADFTLDGKSLNALGYPGAPDDSEEKVFNDIVTQGFYLSNQKLVEHYIRQAPARLKEMIDEGEILVEDEPRAITRNAKARERFLGSNFRMAEEPGPATETPAGLPGSLPENRGRGNSKPRPR